MTKSDNKLHIELAKIVGDETAEMILGFVESDPKDDNGRIVTSHAYKNIGEENFHALQKACSNLGIVLTHHKDEM